MADQIKKLSAGHSIEVLDAIMTEVEEARGEYDNLGERLDEMSSDTPTPSTAAPAMDGTAAAGTSTDYARADHIHPSDTSKQDALNAAQLAAVNSGIDSTKVAQIETNKNNILSLINGGAKNICNMSQSAFDSRAVASATVTRSADTISITGSTDTTTNAFANIYVIGSSQFVPTSNAIPAGDWVAVINGTGTGINSISLAGVYGSTVLRGEVGQPVAFTMPNDVSNSILRLYVEPSTAYDCSFKIMICSAAAWAASHQYEDYCPTLAELYALVKSYHS